MMELRIPVEAEAAALAATRRSPAQEVVVFEAIDALDEAIAGGQDTAKLDLAFHMAIARATNNPRFELCLEALGIGAIPRVGVSSHDHGGRSSSYDKQLNSEHREIANAIAAGDGAVPRSWMRKHMESGLQRYRDLRASTE
ncbi:FCD domain-containing protein [Epibacterium ulvae]|uniref:FadR/GntR family transcriptional regulator n=1 Tax=Epibacterium ulvae TaxID=1156985 RepID=UPI001BFBFD00|nr:FCD domain-containing protein [Epibacterium ulvae]MBT8155043.1 FCD domain-containing protein [Epibacterium ulvae]